MFPDPYFSLSTIVVPCTDGVLDGHVESLPAVESLRGLRRCVPHQDTRGLDVESVVQIPLAKRPAALAEVKLYAQILLDDVLDHPQAVARQEPVIGALRGEKRW